MTYKLVMTKAERTALVAAYETVAEALAKMGASDLLDELHKADRARDRQSRNFTHATQLERQGRYVRLFYQGYADVHPDGSRIKVADMFNLVPSAQRLIPAGAMARQLGTLDPYAAEFVVNGVKAYDDADAKALRKL